MKSFSLLTAAFNCPLDFTVYTRMTKGNQKIFIYACEIDFSSRHVKLKEARKK